MKTIKLLFAILLCISCNNDDDKVEVSNNKPPEEIETEQPPINYSSIVKLRREHVDTIEPRFAICRQLYYYNNLPFSDTTCITNDRYKYKPKEFVYNENRLFVGYKQYNSDVLSYDGLGRLIEYWIHYYSRVNETSSKYHHKVSYDDNKKIGLDSIWETYRDPFNSGSNYTNRLKYINKYYMNDKGLIYKIEKRLVGFPNYLREDLVFYDTNLNLQKIKYSGGNSIEYTYYDEEYRRPFFYEFHYLGENFNNYFLINDFKNIIPMKRKGDMYIKTIKHLPADTENGEILTYEYNYEFDSLKFPTKLTYYESGVGEITEEYFYKE
ncbi:hypothetical protein IWQ47_002981 [Aquimarina sp. EL_43]|uniref:hypothetical protein n=1 Tax=unclassified Aquimarina TaxID=2627091 RepID=UPI0018C973C6|nr:MULTISPECIES: hypothetical protein [unclassified Aquimarina]MBG6131699.1 hypothetical protein [Aquimarina sp. EL_35]MBG6152160.1 hypothetical protein [Aquimarina sp. EL_32]MBG6169896.1 hypothetical protein [Aquimarina sp. EL_43]